MSMSRPRPKDRSMTSSSTGSAHLSRRDSLPVRPVRPSHRNSTTSQRSSRSQRESFTSDPLTYDAVSDDDESGGTAEEWERGETVGEVKRRKKRDEPMSPVAVVLYVVFFYIIWQILTRSDDSEILGHLPLTHLQSLSSSLHSDLQRQPSQYHLPYHLPQIPSPMPNTQTESPSTFRTVLGVIIYPIYLIITLLATPFPLLLNALHLLMHVLGTILYPITATGKLLGRTFILAPLGVASSILAVFYPVYVFIAGVIGIGCVLGLGAGWIGKLTLDTLFGTKKTKHAKHVRMTAGRGRSDKSRSNAPSTGQDDSRRYRSHGLSPSTEEEREQLYTPRTKSVSIVLEDEAFSGDDYDYSNRIVDRSGNRQQRLRTNTSRSVGERDATVVGLRKRGHRDSWQGRQ